MNIGNRIQELCTERNITLIGLSATAKMSLSTLKSIVYGKTDNPGIVTLSKICTALDISLSDFFS